MGLAVLAFVRLFFNGLLCLYFIIIIIFLVRLFFMGLFSSSLFVLFLFLFACFINRLLFLYFICFVFVFVYVHSLVGVICLPCFMTQCKMSVLESFLLS